MSTPIIVFSAEMTRANIIRQALRQYGFDVVVCKAYFEVEEAVRKHASLVLVFDTRWGLGTKEIRFLERLSSISTEMTLIVLAKPWAIRLIEAGEMGKGVCLPEPLDPELVATKVKEAVCQKEKRRESSDTDTLQERLKNFLRLD
jgi:DNA-binding NtrC family response regulator